MPSPAFQLPDGLNASGARLPGVLANMDSQCALQLCGLRLPCSFALQLCGLGAMQHHAVTCRGRTVLDWCVAQTTWALCAVN